MLTDFGLAKDVEAESSMTRSGMTLGTPHYMPPEQAQGRVADIDGRSDVYSLGATFYEMMALRPPFEGSAVVDVIQQVVLKDPVSPRRGNPAVDRDLETICLKCLAKEPEKRYGSARELASDLTRFLEGRPILARPVSAWEKFVRRVRRNKGISLALAVLVLVLAAGGIVAWIAAGRLSTAREDKEAERLAKEDERRAKEEAEKEGREAGALLEKGRKVTGVLVSANFRLGRLQEDLKAAAFRNPNSRRKNPLFVERKAEIDRFVESTAKDPASRATALAVQGWLYWLGAAEAEGLSILKEAQALDPDVPWGFLFEGMVRLYRYIDGLILPPVDSFGDEIYLGAVRPESESLRRNRERLQALIEKAAAARVWGESASQEFRQLLPGLRGIFDQNHEQAEAGLSKALDADELVWMRPELFYARAKVRYFQARFVGASEDLEETLKAYPEWEALHTTRSLIFTARAVEATASGGDPRKYLREAKASIEWSVRRNPDSAVNTGTLGTLLRLLANDAKSRGEDPVPLYRAAVEAFERSVLGEVRYRRSWGNSLGVTRMDWFKYAKSKGRERADLIRRAVEDFTEAAAGSAFDVQATSNLGSASILLAEVHVRHGRDAEAEAAFKKGIECFDAVIRETPLGLFAYLNDRGRAHRKWGTFLESRGKDPRPLYRKAIEDGEKAVRLRPEMGWLHHGVADGLLALGRAQRRRGDTSGTEFQRAVESITEAVKRSPATPEFHHTLGNALRTLGESKFHGGEDPREEYAGAIRAFNEALRLDPEDASGYNGLGSTHWLLGQAEDQRGGSRDAHYEKSLAAFDRLIERNPSAWQALGNKGLVLEELGRFEEAEDAYQKALAIVKGAQPVLKQYIARVQQGARTPWFEIQNMARALMKKGEYDKGRRYLVLALIVFERKGDKNELRAKKYRIEAHYNLARIYALRTEGRRKYGDPARDIPEAERRAWQSKALARLGKALELGWPDLSIIRKDTHFAPLRELPEFKALLAEYEEK
jgi:serine/threonine-protein kinase